MLTRIALTINDRKLEKFLEERLQPADVRVEAYGHLKNPWQKTVHSCGDVIVISAALVPGPIESSIVMLNNLPETPTTIVLHESDSPEEHAQLMAAGADVVLYSGISWKNLAEVIESTLESRRQIMQMDHFGRKGRVQPKYIDFASESEAMQLFMSEVQQVGASNTPLLLLGETGVGKEHLAKAIHYESHRAAHPFITVNMASLPDQLLESELFGHKQGAFTGAIRSRRGAFEIAHGGTIFLDEIGEMPLNLQAKLLRVLQDYEVRPLGGEKPIWVDVRVIAATNRDLQEEVALGNFRKDLFYRLSVVTLTIPSLRNRVEDVPLLARRFIKHFQYIIGKDIDGIDETVMRAFCRYDWPGNVRELMNVIERSILLCKTGRISLHDLPNVIRRDPADTGKTILESNEAPEDWQGKTLHEVKGEIIDKVERLYLQMILTQTKGKIGETAELAGIHPRGLHAKMKRYDLRKEDFK